jgi:hypothetical protein
MRLNKNVITTLCMALLVTACASTPSWKNMSEDEIASWKALNLEPAAAQQWRKGGFSPANAETWIKSGFKYEGAANWARENFSPEDARAWKDGGFSLKDAVSNRAKGLTPVR